MGTDRTHSIRKNLKNIIYSEFVYTILVIFSCYKYIYMYYLEGMEITSTIKTEISSERLYNQD